MIKTSSKLEETIDFILINGPVRGLVLLRNNTPKILQNYGVENLPMAMQSTHIIENILSEKEAIKYGKQIKKDSHYHGIGKENFIKAIESLDNPIAIYVWEKNSYNTYNSDNYIVITNISINNNETIIVPLLLKKDNIKNIYKLETGKLTKTYINEIKTIYGKKQINNYLKKHIKSGNLIKLWQNKDRNGGGIQSSTDISVNT